MPRTLHATAAGGPQPLVARPDLAAFPEESPSAVAFPLATPSRVAESIPRGDLAARISREQAALLRKLSAADHGAGRCDVDWSALTDLAERLACLPRLAALRLHEVTSLAPAEIVERWTAARQFNAARNLLLAHEESELLAQFDAARVSAIPLKGVSLARILHNDAAARTAVDIDFAIHPAHIAAAAAVLRERGYRVSLPQKLLQRTAFVRSVGEKNAEVTAVRDHAGVELLIELHWKILPLPDEQVWATLHRYETSSGDVQSLAPELYFLYLCEHLAGHGWAGVRWLCDVADFLHRFAGQLQAPQVLRLAQWAGLRRRVGVTLDLLDAYFGLKWSALDSLRDSAARRMAAQFLLRPLDGGAPAHPSAHHREQLALQDNAARRAAYLLRLVRPTHVEWLRRSSQGTHVRSAAAAWACRAARLAGLTAAPKESR